MVITNEIIFRVLAKFGAWFMDIYTLGRLFRTFTDNTYISRFFRSSDNSVKNVVIYSGDFHIQNYSKFLDRISKPIMSIDEQIFDETQGPNKCLIVDKFTMDDIINFNV